MKDDDDVEEYLKVGSTLNLPINSYHFISTAS